MVVGGRHDGIDLALALIEEDCGREVAIEAARILVVYLRRRRSVAVQRNARGSVRIRCLRRP